MRHPWANTLLLVLLAAELLSGFGGLIAGADPLRWVLWLHSAIAYTILLLLFWKGQVIATVLSRRGRLDGRRLVFLAMAALTLVIIGLGLWWTFGGPRALFGFSLMTLHAVLALALLALLIWHTLARRFVFRVRPARDRRAFLRLVGFSAAGLALWQTSRAARSLLGLPGAQARFTGSYQATAVAAASLAAIPTVSWLFDNPAPVDAAKWRLAVDGAVARPLTLSYPEVQRLGTDRVAAVLDCTGGWYAQQEWEGVSLDRLLALCGVQPGARSIRVVSVSGYGRRFPLAELPHLLLALGAGGEPLGHGHGYPLRLVAPGYRGFAWVKWVQRIEVSEVSPLWQPPVPLR